MNAYTDIITNLLLAAFPSAVVRDPILEIYSEEDYGDATDFDLVMHPGTIQFNHVNSAGDLGAVFLFESEFDMDCPVHELLDLVIENHEEECVEHVVFCNTETKD